MTPAPKTALFEHRDAAAVWNRGDHAACVGTPARVRWPPMPPHLCAGDVANIFFWLFPVIQHDELRLDKKDTLILAIGFNRSCINFRCDTSEASILAVCDDTFSLVLD